MTIRLSPMVLLHVGKMVDGGVAAILIVGVAVGRKAVGYHHIAALQYGVVAHDLRQNFVVCLDVRLFALHDDVGLSRAVHSDDVGALCHAVNLHGVLLDNLLGLDVARGKHILHNMTAHPLLGREHEPLATHAVEDLGAAALTAAGAKVYGREV